MNEPIREEISELRLQLLRSKVDIQRMEGKLGKLEDRLERAEDLAAKFQVAEEHPTAVPTVIQSESPPLPTPAPEPPPLPVTRELVPESPVQERVEEVIRVEELPPYIEVENTAIASDTVEPVETLSHRLGKKMQALGEQVPSAGKQNLETRIGEVWFNRIGIVAIVVAMALLARLVSPVLQPWHKVALSFLTGFGIFGGGAWLARKFLAFGRSLMAAGISIVFLAAYGMHFVPTMALVGFIPSVLCMLMAAGWLLCCAESWKSQGYAGFALFLGYAAAYVAGGDTTGFSLTTLVILSATSLVLVIRNNWYPLSVFSLFAAYISHALWGVSDGAQHSPTQLFLNNFPYLTAYYLVFLASGAVFARRMASGVLVADAAQRNSGRFLGPVNLIMYSAFALGIFHTTGVYWDAVHYFILPLAFVQVVVAIHQHYCRESDYAAYLAAAVTFFTMGLFSLADGLSLNLALAVEALLLLLASRRQRLWILNPLAQVVLAINFVHYWLSDAHVVATWPVFAGTLVTTLVYVVKARLEETWNEHPAFDLEEGASVTAVRRVLDRLTPHLAPVHMVLAAVILVWQCTQFFGGPWEAVWIGGASLLLALAALRWPGNALVFGAVLLAALNLFPVYAAWMGGVVFKDYGSSTIWMSYLIATLSPIVGGIVLSIRRPGATLWRGPLQSTLLLMAALPAVCIAPMLGSVSSWFLPIALLPAMGYGWVACRGGAHAWPLGLGLALSAGIALWYTVRDPVVLDWLLPLGSLILVSVTVQRKRFALVPGLVLYALLSSIMLLVQADSASEGPALLQAAVLAFSALLMMHQGRVHRQSGYVYAALALVVFGAGFMLILSSNSSLGLKQFLLWPGIALGFYGSLQSLLGMRGEIDTWKGGSFLGDLVPVAGLFSLFVTFALTAVLQHVFASYVPELRAFTLLALGAFALAYQLRSVVFAIAYGGLLLAAHLMFIAAVPGVVAIEAPLTAACLVLLTLAAGLGSERILRKRLDGGHLAYTSWFIGGASVVNVLGLLSGCLVVHAWGDKLLGVSSLAYALQMLVPLFAVFLGRRFNTPGHVLFALGATACLSCVFLLGGTGAAYLMHAGIVIALGLVVMDRLCAGMRGEPTGDWILEGIRLSAWVFPPLVAATLLLSQAGSPGLQGGWTTLAWSFSGLAVVGYGFLAQSRIYRHTALVVFAFAIGRVVLLDIAGLETFYRMMAFLALGICLVLVSFLYAAFKKRVA